MTKRLAVLALSLCLIAFAACAQVTTLPANFAAIGASYLPGGSPSIAGTGLYAHLLSGTSGTYAFSVIDAVPTSTKPFTFTTQTSVGVAQKVFTLGSVPVFVPTSAGISWTGTNTGWSWSTGAMALIPLKAGSGWTIMPSARVVKASISGSGYQVIAGIAIGWGW